METKIRNQFFNHNIDLRGTTHDGVVCQAAEICRRFQIDPESLLFKWKAHASNRQLGSDTIPTVKTLSEIKTELERSEQRSKKSVTHNTSHPAGSYDKDNVGAVFNNDFADLFGVEAETLGGTTGDEKSADGGSSFKTPARAGRRSRLATGGLAGIATPQSTTKDQTPTPVNKNYSSRQNAGTVETVYNPMKFDVNTKNMKHPTELGIAAFEGPDQYRYMFQKIRDIADVIDERIDVLGERITKKHELLKTVDNDGKESTSQLAHVALPNQEEVTVVGRICLDAAGEGKLNAKSVILEGSRMTSSGARVQLNLDNLPSFAIFPGQIVAAKGINATGTNFLPSMIYQGAQYPMMRSSPEVFLDNYFSGNDDGVQVVDLMVASGPFTTVDDLSYAPLDDLIDVIKRESPDAVVLLGPFIDEKHPVIKSGQLDVTYDMFFEAIVERIAENVITPNTTTELIFLPSLKDVHHDDVYPQPAFKLPERFEHERIHCLSNPSTFMIKEVTIGCSTTDTLMDLGKQETSRSQGGDRIGRLANHVLQQRSYYPLLPPAPDVNLEYNQFSHVNLPKITPDIMLMPSDLVHFAKNINGSLVVNPGRLTKRSSGGTYAKISIHAPRRNDIPESSGRIPHGVHDRSVVQIVRV